MSEICGSPSSFVTDWSLMIALKPKSAFGLVIDWGEPGNCTFLFVSDGIGRIVSEVLLSMLYRRGLYCFYRRLIRLTSRWNDWPVASKGPGRAEEFLRVFEIMPPIGEGFFLADELSFSWKSISRVPEPFFAKPILLNEKPGLSFRPMTWTSSRGEIALPYWPGPGPSNAGISCVTRDW